MNQEQQLRKGDIVLSNYFGEYNNVGREEGYYMLIEEPYIKLSIGLVRVLILSGPHKDKSLLLPSYFKRSIISRCSSK